MCSSCSSARARSLVLRRHRRKLDKKQGEWQEFYIPMSAFKYSRGDIKTLDLPEMQKRTMMEFHLTGLKKDGPVSTVDIDGIEFVDAAGAAEIQKRLK